MHLHPEPAEMPTGPVRHLALDACRVGRKTSPRARCSARLESSARFSRALLTVRDARKQFRPPATGAPDGQTPAASHHPAAGSTAPARTPRERVRRLRGSRQSPRAQESRVIRSVHQPPRGEIPFAAEVTLNRALVCAEISGTNSAQSWICFLICESQASPPRSSLLSNHTSTPAARSASQMRAAASASWRRRKGRRHRWAETVPAWISAFLWFLNAGSIAPAHGV